MRLNLYNRHPILPAYTTLGNISNASNPETADVWVAFDFGDGGVGAGGQLRPGFANYSIAKYLQQHATVASFDQRRGRAVYHPTVRINAQTLVAQVLQEICPGLRRASCSLS
ncbi:MAG TPA: hypothetical protein VFB59_03300 [Candidatus Saccharimonadales bacterium]|nr:hypothetical protein [Candidatus Saccharimonadales bacterium]